MQRDHSLDLLCFLLISQEFCLLQAALLQCCHLQFYKNTRNERVEKKTCKNTPEANNNRKRSPRLRGRCCFPLCSFCFWCSLPGPTSNCLLDGLCLISGEFVDECWTTFERVLAAFYTTAGWPLDDCWMISLPDFMQSFFLFGVFATKLFKQ